MLAKHAALKETKIKDPEPILNKVAGHAFHNTSKLNFQKLKGEPDKAAQNLPHYIKSFSSKARQIFEYFKFEKEIAKLDDSDRLYLAIGKFADIDLHPDAVPNIRDTAKWDSIVFMDDSIDAKTVAAPAKQENGGMPAKDGRGRHHLPDVYRVSGMCTRGSHQGCFTRNCTCWCHKAAH